MVLAELLRLVESTSKPLTCGQLADRLGIDPAVVAGMLDWLSRSGRLRGDLITPVQGTCGPSACGVPGPCGTCPLAALPDTGRRFLAARRLSP